MTLSEITVTDIIEELRSYGMPDDKARRLADQLIGIGANSAAHRTETVSAIVDQQLRRAEATGRAH